MQTQLCSLFISASLLFSTGGFAQQHIAFPYDTAPVTVDGILTASEWNNAKSIMIPVNTTDNIEVKFKHDNTAMYFAFSGKLESAQALFPEILTDAANAGGTAWKSGQWWLHVSATDCENEGGYGVYNNCKVTQPDWTGAPNFDMTPPNTDTVEIRIPFSKVGFNIATQDTMGMVMMVTNTATIFKLYPQTADRNVPSTWAKATFDKFPVNIPSTPTTTFKIYPNPANDVINLSGIDVPATISITDLTGKTLQKIATGKSEATVLLSNYASGTYVITVATQAGNQGSMLFVKQ